MRIFRLHTCDKVGGRNRSNTQHDGYPRVPAHSERSYSNYVFNYDKTAKLLCVNICYFERTERVYECLGVRNKTGSVSTHVTLKCLRMTTVAVEKQ